jgi:hypothetical protein
VKLGEIPPGHCLQCGYPLGDSPSPDFCSPGCQGDWYSEHVGVQRLARAPDAALVYPNHDAARWYPPGADEGDWSAHIDTSGIQAALERFCAQLQETGRIFSRALAEGLEQIAAALPAPSPPEPRNPPPEGQDTGARFREALAARQARNTGPPARPGRRSTDRPR